MATVDEIEGVRLNTDDDTGSCSRQELRKYAFLSITVQPGMCRKGRASHLLRTFLSKHRDVRCEASTTHRSGMRHASATPTSCFCKRPTRERPAAKRCADTGVVNGVRRVLPKDFDVSETPFCYPLEIARWPCDQPHVTPESLILLRLARGKHRLANSYITKIHSWQRQPGSPTPLRRGSTRVLPCGPRTIGQSVSFIPCARMIFLALLHLCTRRPSSWRCCMELGKLLTLD